MIHDLKSYPAYKDSGVPWLGQVPEHWEVKRQRNVVKMLVSNVDKHVLENEDAVRLCNYIDVYKNDKITERIPFMHASASIDEIKRFKLKVGDVIITKDSETWNDIAVPALVEYEAPDLICGYHLAILRPFIDLISGGYLFRALQSQGVESQFYVSANGVTRYGLSHEAIKSVLIPVPSIPEQSAIVRYLDYMDRRIRHYIHAKQKLIKLLEEQKQAIIHRAVTRGLDPNVKLKPSGVEWLGDVPEHWDIKRIKHLALLKSGESITSLEINKKGDYPVFGGNGLRGFTSNYTHNGDFVLIGRQGALCGNVNYASGYFWASEHAVVANPIQVYNLLWFGELLRTMNLNQYSISAAQPGLSVERIQNIGIPVPLLEEQKMISEYIASSTDNLDNAISFSKKEITLLREYRTRLIADVVTGKLDVREAAASLPDELEEPEVLEDEVGEGLDDEQATEFEEEDGA